MTASTSVDARHRLVPKGALVVAALALAGAVAIAAGRSTPTSDEPAVDLATTAVFPHDGRAFDDASTVTSAFVDEMLGIEVSRTRLGTPDLTAGTVAVAIDGGSTLRVEVAERAGNWFVLAATGDGISLGRPVAGQIVASPVAVAGDALAPGRALSLRMFSDGEATAMAETTAVVGDSRPTAFTATLPFETPRAYWGVLVVRALDDTGRVVDASVVRVGY